MFLDYVWVFIVGGAVCLIGQVLINLTKMSAARILVIFLLLGVLLEAIGVFEPIKEFAKAGVTIPIIGFGGNLAKGAIEGAESRGLIGAVTGGLQTAAAGVAGAIFVGFVVAVFAKSKTKK
ncbi:MAG: SpoVA/SpoVAEb family sporulation membrane protein [Clostridia bacterium]|nr:SpoVA/SpoVAEb family sporulation membrane protein [Clostridia bacterium]